MIAGYDRSRATDIARRYSAATGHPFDSDAALGYDAVALAAGIGSALGPAALNAQTLQAETGFRGVTGLFRLRADGSVERQYSIYQIRQGQLTTLRGPTGGF